MKRVIAFSDSHGDESSLQEALQRARLAGPVDVVVFLGDGARDFEKLRPQLEAERIDCRAVAGNNDWSSASPTEIEFTVGGVRFYACHGHSRGVKYGLDRLYYAAQERGAQVALYGHTHRAAIDFEGGVCLVNPGAVGSYVHGQPVYAEIRVEDHGVFIPRLFP